MKAAARFWLSTLALGTVGAVGAVAGLSTTAQAASRNFAVASNWTIGPLIRGRNYSRGMPLRPASRPGGGWQVELPLAPRSIHYVTFRHGSLVGKRRIVMRYRIEADPDVRIFPRTAPASPSMITLYVQRRDDDWSGRGPYEAYRWFANFATQSPVTPGDHVLIAPFTGNWSAVQSSTVRTNPAAFRAALADADEVGFVLGGGDGLGHGVSVTGRARLIVTSFRIE